MPLDEKDGVTLESSLFWDQLLELIDDGRVVPIVSKDLLTFSGANGPQLLYPYLAERLANYLGVPGSDLPEGGELNEVACRYLGKSNDNPVQRIYAALKKVVTESETLPIPVPLLQLAAIRPFRLFVSTTFDSSLARALNQVRCNGSPGTRVLSYSPDKKDDLPVDIRAAEAPIVYHLLGKVSVTPSYAVTQWDLVEYFHALQSETRGPKLLFDELKSQSMLILGSSFGSWLARLFLRMAKGQLGSGTQTADYIADPQVNVDTSLVLFIRHFSRATEIYPGGSAEFVNELYQRWIERHPDPEAQTPTPDPAFAPARDTGAVFLSYASEDRAAVEKIRDALRAAGIDVFFDKDDLYAGEAWEAKLRRKVRECSLFVPVISRHTLTPGRRFFRVEWNLALEEAQMASFSDEEGFLMPVVIDGTRADEPGVPPRFKAVQWQALQGGETPPSFVGRVQELYRRYQKAIVTGVS